MYSVANTDQNKDCKIIVPLPLPWLTLSKKSHEKLLSFVADNWADGKSTFVSDMLSSYASLLRHHGLYHKTFYLSVMADFINDNNVLDFFNTTNVKRLKPRSKPLITKDGSTVRYVQNLHTTYLAPWTVPYQRIVLFSKNWGVPYRTYVP